MSCGISAPTDSPPASSENYVLVDENLTYTGRVPDLWTDLLACLDVAPLPSADGDIAMFEGRNQQLDYHRVFGGQLLAQFLRIASLTCPDKAIKSQHAIFVREGRADEPVRYEATLHHEGRSFAAATIIGRQSRGVIATSSISMHAVEDGPEHQQIEDVPAVLGAEHELALDLIPWETRAAVDLNATTTGPPRFEFWMRTPAVDPATRTRSCRLRHRPDVDRYRPAADRRRRPARQRHHLHLCGHLAHRVVPPAVPHR